MAPMTSRTSVALASAALLLLLVRAGPAAAEGPLDFLSPASANPKPAEKAAAPAPPEAIPLPRIVPTAVEAYRTLAAIRARTGPDASLDEMLAPLDELARSVERAGALMTSRPVTSVSDRDLVDFRQEMRRQDAVLGRWSSRIEGAVRSTYDSVKELERMAEVWKLTGQQASQENAGSAIVERVQGVREEIADLQKSVRARLDRLLAAQDRVASLRIRILGWMGAADKADTAREQQLFEIEARPIWQVFSRKAPARDFGVQLERVFQHNVSAMSAFLREEGTGFLWVLAAFVVVVAAVTWAGRAFTVRAATDPELAAPAEVLSHPISAGVLVALSLTSWLLPRAPAVVSELTILLALPSFLALARKLLAPDLRPPLYGFTALFAVARLGAVLPEASLPGRFLVLLVALVGLVGAVRMLRRGAPWTRAIARPRRRKHLRIAVSLLAILLAASLLANVIGNVSLGRRLADGSLSTGMLALLLAAVSGVLRALLVGGLRMPEVHRVQTLAENAPVLAEKGSRFIEWAALLLWVAGTLRFFYVETSVLDALTATFSARLRFGGLDVSLGDLAAFVVALWLSVLLARLLRVVLEAWLDRDAKLPAGVPVAISKTVGYAVVGMGFLVAILASGMDVTRFTVILGTLSVGIGFGLQNVVNNFVSGLILLYERPIRVGDVIEVGTAAGTVTHIGIRSSTIKTFPGAEVVLPNSTLVSNQLTNWTLSDPVRRVDVEVGVAYGSDVARVQEILVLAARSSVDVLSDPAPVALFTGLGDSALTFQLRLWTSRSDRYLALGSEVRAAVVGKLAEAGISIPFPQQDLHVVSVEESAARVLRGGDPAGK